MSRKLLWRTRRSVAISNSDECNFHSMDDPGLPATRQDEGRGDR